MTNEYLEALRIVDNAIKKYSDMSFNLLEANAILSLEKALQRLDKYEQILSSGRLTDRNYKNTTLDLDSCKPYVRLGQLEDIYEEGKKND